MKFEIYHKSLSSAIHEVQVFIAKKKLTLKYSDTWEQSFAYPQPVSYGQTVRYSLELAKKRAGLQVQIYRMDSGTYELNMYVL